MNQHLQKIFDTIKEDKNLSGEEKNAIIKSLKEADKEIEIVNFKLDRTEKVKKTTAILLEETIEELEHKRKAVEAQNRELEIESSLERVRAVAMSMMKAEDLLKICEAQFNELKQLGFSEIRNALIGIFHDDKKYFTDYDYSDFAAGNIHKIPYNKNSLVDRALMRMKSASDAFTEFVVEGEELAEWKVFRKQNGEYEDTRIDNADKLYYYFYSIDNGNIGISTFKKINDDQLTILKRFRNVFDLAYKRYADITTAEAQAREAQIEVALERVRAEAMSMHKSEDLHAAVAIVFEELEKLNLGVLRCGISVLNKEKRSGSVWLTSTDGEKAVQVTGDESFDIHPLLHGAFEAWLRQEDFYYELAGSDLVNYYTAVNNAKFMLPESQVLTSDNNIKQFCFVAVYNSGGLFAFQETAFTEEAKKIMRRFAAVFDLTYKRFLDLQKAEANAREAQIETALERVRSRTLAMQKSDELAETAAVLFRQLILLGIQPNRLYIAIVKDEKGKSEFWITDEDGAKVSSAFETNLNNNASFKKMFDGWKEGKRSLVIDMQGEELQQYFEYLASIHVPFKGGLTQQRRLQDIAYFSKGFIGMASPEEQPAETLQLLERFAAVFNLTYTRFNDLQVSEAHAIQAEQDLIAIKEAKQKAEEALIHLQAAQRQLIQSEKMASLGELTAGIAHEIQNPLNFVNNFSEVNKELIVEMVEEVEKGNLSEVKAIANDIKENEEKINHHGKRADAIVKGMLQHSRSSSGQKEPADINALCDEYLRLSYHGLRAKDKSFNATLKTKFDESIGKINMIPQDVGRVIMNLLTNAFYAVNEKAKLTAQDSQLTAFEPTVSISTKKLNNKIEIAVSDNGNGIPDAIKEKIFQPFFTTKPTGQGTGLGLSLSYDIITKGHGGELKMETKEGEGCKFSIRLPITGS